MVIVFDVIGTLFSLHQVRSVLRKSNVRDGFLEMWFSRLLHSAATCTMLGNYQSFSELMPSTLRQSLIQQGYAEELTDKIMLAFKNLQLWDDAQSCLTELKQQSHQLIALTNGSEQSTHHLMEQAGILNHFDAIYSCDAVKSCKPHPKPYQLVFKEHAIAPGESCMVAAHAWDIMGAHAAGMKTIWVSRLETIWPYPGNPPDEIAAHLKGVKNHITERT